MVLVIVVSHWYENLNWLKNSPWEVVVCDKNGSAKSPFSPNKKCTLDINKGREASTYLKYIVEYYDKLPDHIAFIHGHEYGAWHQKYPGHLFEAIRKARVSEYDYISLNNFFQIKTRFKFCECYINPKLDGHLAEAPDLFKCIEEHWDIFQPIFKTEECPGYFRYNCGAQFIVSRKAIRQYPISFYKSLLRYMLDGSNDYTKGVTLESVWGIIFGEDDNTIMNDLQYRKTRFNGT